MIKITIYEIRYRMKHTTSVWWNICNLEKFIFFERIQNGIIHTENLFFNTGILQTTSLETKQYTKQNPRSKFSRPKSLDSDIPFKCDTITCNCKFNERIFKAQKSRKFVTGKWEMLKKPIDLSTGQDYKIQTNSDVYYSKYIQQNVRIYLLFYSTKM